MTSRLVWCVCVLAGILVPGPATADVDQQAPARSITCKIAGNPPTPNGCSDIVTLEAIGKTTPPPTIVTIAIASHVHGDGVADGYATLLRLRARPGADASAGRIRATLRSGAHTPMQETDAPTRAAQFVIAAGAAERQEFSGELAVSREDFGADPIVVDVSIEHVLLEGGAPGWYVGQLAQGQTERTWIPEKDYALLQRLGVCSGERRKDCKVDHHTYNLVSRLLGRQAEQEFTANSTNRKANRSEPIVLFVGLSGATGIALLDCRHSHEMIDFKEEPEGTLSRTCVIKADPWSISFERAPYFWAAYLEDVDAPYRTTIDVEFRLRAEPADYEEFDPNALAGRPIDLRTATPDKQILDKELSDKPIQIRVGFRRFRMRDPPAHAQVAFSREGQGYGLRQWIRTFRQYGQRRWGVAAGALVSAVPGARRRVTTRDVYADGATQPFARELVEETRQRVLFAYGALRWYQWRDRTVEMPAKARLWRTAILPDVVFGIGVSRSTDQTFVTNFSWPIIGDRYSFVFGAHWAHDDIFRDGYAKGTRVPLGTDAADVTRQRWSARVSVGLAVDLLQWR
jgi:hypothetical protein